jgi:hypothetical protein
MNFVDRQATEHGHTGRQEIRRARWTRCALHFGYWKQFVEKRKENWKALARGLLRTIAEEEMRISREEFGKQLGNRASRP